METLKQIAARAIASAKNTWDFINGNAAQEQLNAIKGEKEKYGTEQLETQSGFPQKTLFLAAETGQILSINPGHK